MSLEKPIAATRTALQTSKSSKTRQNKLGVLTSTWISNQPLWSYTRKLLNLIDEYFPNCSVAYSIWLQRTLDGLKWENDSIAENATIEAFLFKHLYSAFYWRDSMNKEVIHHIFFHRAGIFLFFVWTSLSELLHYYYFFFKCICHSGNRT